MKKLLLILSAFLCTLTHAQIVERITTAQELPTLISGFSQVSSVNIQTLNVTFTPPPSDPQPVDEDTTTEHSGPFTYGTEVAVSYSVGNGNFTQTSAGVVWTLAIKALGGVKNIGITFNSLNLTTSAELYVYNESKTVLLGPVKGEYFSQPGTLTTDATKDSVVIIYILERGNFGAFQSSFNISQVVAGFVDLEANDTNPQAKITAATGCMKHVQCFSDKMNFANAVARVSVGGKGGSGTLINNEENNARPFFLTAFHVLDRDEDNILSTSEINAINRASFRFKFWNNGCSTSTTNTGITFTGAILRASWKTKGGADMVLLELDNYPGLADGVTYAGWNRTSDAPYDNSSFIIHHPEGKNMRLTETRLVRTYILNSDYWQAFYKDYSAVVGGSSGGALFNQNNQIVGQLYGGWSSCAGSFSDRYGKLSRSWSGGGTTDSRLSDWLSPVNNLSSTYLFNPTIVSIQGSDHLCNGQKQYTVSHSLFNVTYDWQVSNNLQIISGQGTPTITVAPVSGAVGQGSIQLTIRSLKGINRSLIRSKNVYIDISPTIITGPYDAQQHTVMGVAYTNQQYYFTASESYVPSPPENYTWTLFPPPGSPNFPSLYSGSPVYITFAETGYHTLRVSKNNSCGSSFTDVVIDVQEGYAGFTMYPNPAFGNVTIRLKEDKKTNKLKEIKQVRILDKFGQVKKQFKYAAGTTSITLDVSNLPSDIYIVEVTDGVSKANAPLSVVK